MERGFLSQKGSGGRRGVKEKNLCASNIEVVKDDVVPSVTGDPEHAVMEVVFPSVVDETMWMEQQIPMVSTTRLGSYPPLPTQDATSAGNAPGKSSYANVTSKPSGKKLNIHTLFTPGCNGIDVVVPVESIRAVSDRFANTVYGFFLGKRVAYPIVANYVRNTWDKFGLVRSMFSASTGLFSFQFSFMDGLDAMLENGPCDDGLGAIATKLGTPLMLDSYTSDMCMQSWGRSSYARVTIELRADVEMKENIVVGMPKITREGHYTCNVLVEYEWKPPMCSSCKVFRHIHEECPKNTSAGEKKTVKKPSHASRGVSVGPKMAFKSQKEYRPVTKKPNTSSSGNKKKCVEPTIEVSNSNPFDVLNSINNDVKFERQTGDGKLRLLDNHGNPLVSTGIMKSDSEVEVVFDDTANLMIPTNDKDQSDI
nr:hypothetical protein [Tanacetum cinerariifolium]